MDVLKRGAVEQTAREPRPPETGTSIPQNDMWIAACVVESGATLLSFDGHFANVPLMDVRILDT